MLFKDPFGALASRCAHRDPDAFDLRRVESSVCSCLDLGEATLAAVSSVCMDLSNSSIQAKLSLLPLSSLTPLQGLGKGERVERKTGRAVVSSFLKSIEFMISYCLYQKELLRSYKILPFIHHSIRPSFIDSLNVY